MSALDSVRLVDSHAHIQGEEFAGDLDGVLHRANRAGVEQIVVVGGAGDLASNERAVELAHSYEGLFATVGMHPHDAKAASEAELARLRELAKDSKVVAIGETGLDFYYNRSPREIQIELFRRFIRMARETGLPIVVHNRDAHREIAGLLRAEGEGKLRGVIHCFTGDHEAAQAFLDLGFYISFSGIVTFKNAATLREVAQKSPLDRLLVETDSPYLAPVPHRGKRNEPAFVREVAEAIARIKDVALEEVARASSQNAQLLFGL